MANAQEIGPQGSAQDEKAEKHEEERKESAGDGEGKEGWLRRTCSTIPKYAIRRPALFFTAALLLGAAGAWGFLNGTHLQGAGPFNAPRAGKAVAEDGLRQQGLSRFYIPMPEDGPFMVMVIDWAVVWDGLSAVRFGKAEVSIRNRIYDSLAALAAKEAGVNDNVSLLEESMNRALRDGLRNESVSVRIKEVKTY